MKILVSVLFMCVVVLIRARAQPIPAPTSGDAPCEEEPATAGPDTAFGFPDEEGFVSIFNGKDFSGWFQNCGTANSSANRSEGGIFRVSLEHEAIYSNLRGSAAGVLMTRKKYTHYEIKFDFWFDYGNEGGIFNRTNYTGQCYKTTLDYRNSGSMGGVWGQGGFGGRDLRPWGYNSDTTINLNTGRGESWTAITRALDPTSYGCPESGCGQSDYNRLWDADGWNEMRIQFYGGHVEDNTFKMKSWFRSEGADTWVPIIQDTTWNHAPVAEGYIGIGFHGGPITPLGRWYRNIKLRPLEADGTPIIRGCRDSSHVEYNPMATMDYPGACQNVDRVVLKNELKQVEWGEDLSVTIHESGVYALRILDVTGAVLHEKKVNTEGHHRISDVKFEAGVYFLQVIQGQNSGAKKYFLK